MRTNQTFKWWFFLIGILIFPISMMLSSNITHLILGKNSEALISLSQIIQFLFAILIAFSAIYFHTGTLNKDTLSLPNVQLKKGALIVAIFVIIQAIVVYFSELYFPALKQASIDQLTSLNLGNSFTKDIIALLLICVFAPIFEEIIFRGIILKSLKEGLSEIKQLGKHRKTIATIVAIAVSTYAFVSIHTGEEANPQMILLAFSALFYALVYSWTDSLPVVIMTHCINNCWAIFSMIFFSKIIIQPTLWLIIFISPVLVLLVICLVKILISKKKNSSEKIKKNITKD